MKRLLVLILSLSLFFAPPVLYAQSSLTKKIKTRLQHSILLKSKGYVVSFETIRGAVTIDGEADSETTRAIIYETVKATEGVKTVVNNVAVNENMPRNNPAQPELNAMLADLTIELGSEPALRDSKISLSSADGIVTISGFVSTSQQKEEVERLIREKHPSWKIGNKLIVGSPESDFTLAKKVKDAYAEVEDINQFDISVLASNGTIILDGSLPNFRAVDQVLATTLNVPGVLDIENRLRINGKSYQSIIAEGSAAKETDS